MTRLSMSSTPGDDLWMAPRVVRNMEAGSASPGSSKSSLTMEEVSPIMFSWRGVDVFSRPAGRRWLRHGYAGATEPSTELHILKNVTGLCRPGELLAIMGASGAGKTTLLNVLTHRSNDKLRITGDLFVNGRRVDPDTLTSRSAYVQQDDLFIDLVTVKEQLIFQAALRMDRRLTHEERLARVDQVIMDLGLSDCEHTRIGTRGQVRGLSGGEIKRLSFACEVLTNPSLLFCDEPTSGLDSFMAQNVVGMMKGLAERGKTVLSTIHQPSSQVYNMFDRVLLMVEGRVAFLGDPDEALRFFAEMGMTCPAQYNPADYFINQLSVNSDDRAASMLHINAVCEAYEVSSVGRAMEEDVVANQRTPIQQDDLHNGQAGSRSPYKTSWTTQFHWVLWRSWLETAREPRVLRIRFLQVLTFCSHKELFLREHHNGMYRPDVYFLAKTMVEGPFFTFYTIVYTAIFYFLAGFGGDVSQFLTCLLTSVLVTWCALSFGYSVSCASSSVDVAFIVMTPFDLVFLFMGGFFLNLRSIPSFVTWIHYLSWFGYSNEILVVSQWSGVTNITCAGTSRCYPDGAAILNQLNFSEANVIPNLASLCGLIVGYSCLAYFFLYLRALRSKP